MAGSGSYQLPDGRVLCLDRKQYYPCYRLNMPALPNESCHRAVDTCLRFGQAVRLSCWFQDLSTHEIMALPMGLYLLMHGEYCGIHYLLLCVC